MDERIGIMSFRTILGRAFLTSTDWIIINSDLDKIRAYTAEILEQERRKEEKRKAAEARERARKAEEARLAAIRKAEEERKRAEEERKREEERLARRRAEQKILDDLLR